MKTKIALLATVAILGRNSFGGEIRPNLIICAGPKNTTLSYTTSSIEGTPTFNLKYQGQEVRFDDRSGIHSENSRMGTLVSVTDYHLSLVDGPTYHYSFIMPLIKLGSMTEAAKFNSFVFKTTVANPFFMPQDMTLVLQQNEVVPIQCSAERVFF